MERRRGGALRGGHCKRRPHEVIGEERRAARVEAGHRLVRKAQARATHAGADTRRRRRSGGEVLVEAGWTHGVAADEPRGRALRSLLQADDAGQSGRGRGHWQRGGEQEMGEISKGESSPIS